MASSNTIYKITINNWDKHNSSKKKNHRYILLHCGFLSDSKISILTPVTRLLYLSLLLVAGESTSSQIEVTHKSLWSQSGVKSQSIESQLSLLQSLQLLTYEKIEVLNNTIEKKRKEKKTILKGNEKKNELLKNENLAVQPVVDKSPTTSKTNLFISHYCNLFKQRYSTNPEISKKEAGIAKRISESLSEEKIYLYLDAFFAMPDSWLVKIKHPISIFETKKNEIIVFANSGKFTTNKQANQLDQSLTDMSVLQQIREGKL